MSCPHRIVLPPLALVMLVLSACGKPTPPGDAPDAASTVASPTAATLVRLAFSDFPQFHASLDAVERGSRSALATQVVEKVVKRLSSGAEAPQAVRVLMFLERYLTQKEFAVVQKALGDWAFAGLDWSVDTTALTDKLARIPPGYYGRLGERALLPAALAVARGLRTYTMLEVLTAPTGTTQKRAVLLARAVRETTVQRRDVSTMHLVALATLPHKATAEALLKVASTTTIYAYRNEALALAQAMLPKLSTEAREGLEKKVAAIRARPLTPKSPLGALAKGGPWKVPAVPEPERQPRPALRVPQPRQLTQARTVAPRTEMVKRHLQVRIATNAIEARTRRVATVDEGPSGAVLDPVYLESGSADSFLVLPLVEVLETQVRREKELAHERERPADLVARLTPDIGTTFRLLAQAIHTGGMAGIEQWELGVSGPGQGPPRSILLATPRLDEDCLQTEGGERRPRKTHTCVQPSSATVWIGKDSVRLTVQYRHGARRPPDVLKARSGTLPLHQLYNALRKLRTDAPEVTHLNVGAGFDVRWQTLVQVIDAATVRRTADRFDSLEAYRQARVRDDWDAGFTQMMFVVSE